MILNYSERKLKIPTHTKTSIAKKCNSKSTHHYIDWDLYEIKRLVKNTFAKLTHSRGIATRYDKRKRNDENSVALPL